MTEEYAINRGDFHLSLMAMMENTDELPVPDTILKHFKKLGHLRKTTLVQIPPHIQPLYVELARASAALEKFSPDGSVLEKATLERRILALEKLKISLVFEFIPKDKVPLSNCHLAVGPKWMLYLIIPQEQQQIRARS
jgi:hypothetical protein